MLDISTQLRSVESEISLQNGNNEHHGDVGDDLNKEHKLMPKHNIDVAAVVGSKDAENIANFMRGSDRRKEWREVYVYKF